MIDPTSHYLFASNTTRNRVEVFNLGTYELESPIGVGIKPYGLDLTPNGTALYVANSGDSNISVVDVGQRKELRKIIVPPQDGHPDTPFSIAITNKGRALFTTTQFCCTGYGGRMMALNLATDALTHRAEFYINNSIDTQTFLEVSGDRNKVGIIFTGEGPGSVFMYFAEDDTFSDRNRIDEFLNFLGLNASGSTMMVGTWDRTYIFDGSLATKGTMPASGQGGVAPAPSGSVGYRVAGSKLEVLDLSSFQVTRTLALGDSATTYYTYPNAISRLVVSPDGKIVVATTDHGFSVLRP